MGENGYIKTDGWIIIIIFSTLKHENRENKKRKKSEKKMNQKIQ